MIMYNDQLTCIIHGAHRSTLSIIVLLIINDRVVQLSLGIDYVARTPIREGSSGSSKPSQYVVRQGLKLLRIMTPGARVCMMILMSSYANS